MQRIFERGKSLLFVDFVALTATFLFMPPRQPLLDLNGKKSRYGVSYIQNICAQSGFPFEETGADQDVQAIDGEVRLRKGPVYVQVKCSSAYSVADSSTISFPIKQGWIEKWKEIAVPVYLVLVTLADDDFENWISHQSDATTHQSMAYWIKFDPQMAGLTLNIPTANRFDLATFDTWHDDFDQAFGIGATS